MSKRGIFVLLLLAGAFFLWDTPRANREAARISRQEEVKMAHEAEKAAELTENWNRTEAQEIANSGSWQITATVTEPDGEVIVWVLPDPYPKVGMPMPTTIHSSPSDKWHNNYHSLKEDDIVKFTFHPIPRNGINLGGFLEPKLTPKTPVPK